MRTYWIMALSTFGLLFIATAMVRPPVNALTAGDMARPSIAIEQLSVNTKDLPVQAFDTF